DYFDAQVNLGRQPEEFGRIWIHTHPGACPRPSGTDEETFRRVFGRADWAVMFILARGGKSYARLAYHFGPSCELPLGVDVDYSQPFQSSDRDAWQAEYRRCVRPKPCAALATVGCQLEPEAVPAPTDEWYDWRFDSTTFNGWREEVSDDY